MGTPWPWRFSVSRLEPLVRPQLHRLESAVYGFETPVHASPELDDRITQPLEPACVFCHLVLDDSQSFLDALRSHRTRRSIRGRVIPHNADSWRCW